MIERLLAAERALAADQVEVADRMFGQVAAADPRNAIAVVGLARVAQRRGDLAVAAALAQRALEIDADDAVARTLVDDFAAVASTPAGHAAEEAEAVGLQQKAERPLRGGLIGWLSRLFRRTG
jgi:tetratricopeptide (TPR) repeat protein